MYEDGPFSRRRFPRVDIRLGRWFWFQVDAGVTLRLPWVGEWLIDRRGRGLSAFSPWSELRRHGEV